MTKTKKVQMPSGIRNKLMAAIAMLLVSSILMVSSTYAWFTLSTAPEVTGITTSVGANGNLEIALLTTESHEDTALITSAVGDSSAVQAVTDANITWGNLVDLSAPQYGLSTISLQPAAANISAANVLAVASPLMTATYGADGRVAELAANTVSAVRDATAGTFKYDSTAQTYGVRAVGVASNISPRQLTFNSAKTSFNSNKNQAGRLLSTAVNANSGVLIAVAARGTAPDSYDDGMVKGLLAMTQGAQSSLNSIVAAYANAGLAAAASGSATDDQVTTLATAISGVTSAATLKGFLNTAGVTTYDDELTALATAQTSVGNAIATLDTYKTSGTQTSEETAAVTSAVEALYATKDCRNPGGASVDATALLTSGGSIYVSGGAIGAIADQVGKLELLSTMGVTAYAGTFDQSESGALAAVATAVGGLTAPGGAAVTNISDAYGYILDFAFRTNATDSDLQLQTAAVNRVYSDATDEALATQGSGSNVTFTYDASLSDAQAATLLGAVRFVFFDPNAGTVYATGSLANAVAASGTGTANVKLAGQSDADVASIVALDQNVIKFVSVLVYLDGTLVDNDDVANAASSGSLDLNLQFSSSATLQPMENTALRNLMADDATVVPAPALTTADLTIAADNATFTAGTAGTANLSATVGGSTVAATYALASEYTGVSISGSVVTVGTEAAEGSVVVNGTYTDGESNIHTGTFTITINPAD